jgi:hypothetical protein
VTAFVALVDLCQHAEAQILSSMAWIEGGCPEGDAPGFPVTITGNDSYRLTGNLVLGWTNFRGAKEAGNV